MKLSRTLTRAFLIPALALLPVLAENPPQNLKDFVGGHYTELQNELSHGEGASLKSLLDLLHTPPADKIATIKRLHALSEAYPTVSEFVERVPDFAHKDPPAPTAALVPVVPEISEPDLVNLFSHMKYKTRIHVSMLDGEESDGVFSSFDKSRGIIFVSVAGSSVFTKKVYALSKMRNVTRLP